MNDEIILKTFAERLLQLVKEHNTNINDLANKIGIKSKSTIYRYMNAEMAPKLTTIKYLAEIYDVNPVWLMGYDVPKKSIPLKKIDKIKIPVLGKVKAGYDYLAQENIIGYESIDNVPDPENYYALQVTGDSMEPLFSDGDIAIVHKQDDFENGDYCVVLINGNEATVKRVYKGNTGIELKAVNPYYPPKIFTKEEIRDLPVKVIGVVEKSIRNFKKK